MSTKKTIISLTDMLKDLKRVESAKKRIKKINRILNSKI